MPEGRLSIDRAIRSLALGLAGTAGTIFTFGVSLPPHDVTVVWSLFVPLLAALAYGWRGGAIAAFTGGAAYLGFWVWPSNGWANLPTMFIYGGWFVWHGWCAERRRERASWWNHLYVAQLAAWLAHSFIVAFVCPIFLRFNPPFWAPTAPPSMERTVVASIIVKNAFFPTLEVFAADLLLHLPFVRRALGLAVSPSSRLNSAALGASVALGGLAFGLSALVEAAFVDHDLAGTLTRLTDPEHVRHGAVVALVCLVAGLQLAKLIERRLEAEEALRVETQFTDAAIGTLQGIFFVVRPDGRYLRWNAALSRLWGREGESLRELNGLDIVHPDDRAGAETELGRAFETGSGTIELRFVTRPSGVVRRLLCSGRRFEIAGGAYLVGSGIDVTELREAEDAAKKLVLALEKTRSLEDQLRHAQKMEAVGVLAGGVAHDFNNLLSAMVAFASLLRHELPAGSPGQGHVAEILSAAERAAGLTRSLLAFSREQPVSIAPLDVGELVAGFKNMLGRLLSEKIEVRLRLAKAPLVVGGDRGQLEQVLLNLATNARDAMPGGGTLEIATERVALEAGELPAGDYALVTVSDTGTGMDSATLSRIFEPFFTTKEVGRGTGL